jgi:gliding motility-associated-like protein
MRNRYFSWLAAIIIFFTSFNFVVAQTANFTLDFTGFGNCPVCGFSDYACSSNLGNWNSGIKTFSNPVPSGNIVTDIRIDVYTSGDCQATNTLRTLQLNSQVVGTYTNNIGNCDCNTCNVFTITDNNSNGLPYYNYNLINTLQLLVSNGEDCVDRIEVELTYIPAKSIDITLNTLDVCSGSNLSVSFDTDTTTYAVNNTFTVQLSDATGSFASPVNVGNAIGIGSGTIVANIPANTPSGNGYRVRVVASNPAFISDDNGNDITISAKPIAGFTANNNCVGLVTNFQNTSTGATTYLWNSGEGDTTSIINPTHIYFRSGNYTASLIAFNVDGCSDTTSQLISIYDKPEADFSFVSACPNTAVLFNNNSSVLEDTLSYSWSFGDGNLDTAINPLNIYVNAGVYNVQLIATSNFGCADTVAKSVVVYPVPVPDFNVSNVCFGTPSVFQNTSTISNGNITYLWNFGDGTTSNNPTPTKNYNAEGNYTVILTATSNNGCTTSISKQHQVFQQPVAGFEIDNVCLGDTAYFTNTTFGTNVTFQWSFDDGFFSGASNPKHVYATEGTYNVRLISTNLSGCADTFFRSITVYPTPVVAFTGNNICQGETINFNNLTSITTGTLNYLWNFGDGTTSINAQPTKTYTSLGNYLVTLIANSNNGCTDTLAQSFVVFPSSVADFTVSNVCDGDTVFFTNNSTGNISIYAWSFGDGNTSTDIQPAHLYNTPGTYQVQLITDNGNCADTITKSVTVYATPVAAFATANSCLGTPTVFNNQSAISSGVMNFNWSFGDGVTSINASPTHTYLNEGIYTVQLIATSNNNCIDTSTLSVSIYAQPKANIIVNNVCFGTSVVFGNGTNPVADTDFIWYFGDGNTSNDFTPTYNYASAGTFNVSLVAENMDGCKDSVSTTVTVFPQPEANFNINNACLGTTSVFTNLTQISNATLNYVWNFGNGVSSTDINPNYVYDSIGIYTAELIVYSNNGCTDTATKTVVIFPYPQPSFTANVACFDKEVNFSNTTSIAFGSSTYVWEFGDGNNSTLESPAHVYTSLGVFKVKLTATSDQGCVSDIEQFVTVYPNPTANFTAQPVCENDSVQFINLSTISAGTLNYNWNFGNGNVSSVVEPAHVFNNAFGNIPVTLSVTSVQGCVDSITKNITIYPNPEVDFTANNICIDASLKLINNTTISEGSINNYLWNFGDDEVSQQTHPTKNYAATGTYTITLQATSNRGCTDSSSKVIIVYALPDATIRPFGAAAFCDGDSLTLSSGSLLDSFEWSTSESTQTIVVNAQGSYSVTVTSQYGCVATDDINIVVYPLPNAFAGNDTSISKGFDAQLFATGGITYSWTPTETLNNAAIQNPVASPLETTTYTVLVTDSNNCKNTDEVVVTVVEDYTLLVTNVITPNNDGANDQFEIINIETYPQAELLIFDRWGTEVYQSKPYNNDWKGTYKGKELPDGTYYYVIRFEGNDKLYKGTVSILR